MTMMRRQTVLAGGLAKEWQAILMRMEHAAEPAR